MPRTVQIRDIDDEVYRALARRAAAAGLTVPELLRREAARLAARPTVEEWLERTRRRPGPVTTDDVVAALDEFRGPWPDARR
jgi:hypothetical protein